MSQKKLLEIVNYVKSCMDRCPKQPCRAVSVALGHLSDKDLTALRLHFPVVRAEGFMGYVHFERNVE